MMLPETHRDTLTLRVLLVEDDEDDFLITSDLLDEIDGARFSVEWAKSYEGAVLKFEEGAEYDICLLDYRLGGRSGLELLRDLIRTGYRVPIIMLTGQDDPEVDFEAMKSGATDYLVKGRLDSSLLDRSIRYALERRRGEKMLRAAYDELDMRVKERTIELHTTNEALRTEINERKQVQEALVAARKVAEDANRAKSEFLANMSHEIRTPMNGVIGMTEILMDSGLTDEQHEYAETVHDSGEELLRIINDILDFSKIEAGEVHLEIIDFDLRSLVEDTARLLASRAEDRRVELIGFVEPDVPRALRGDPGRLRQIMTNLLANAIKFTSEGEVVLGVGLIDDGSERAVARFEVTDTGIGIPKDQNQRLFEPFTQADASTTRKYGGTGLGLAICRQLVEMMGGEIGAESEPGEGSTFWFTVPLEKQPEGPIPSPSLLAELKGRRVLVVDDNATNRRILRKELVSWGASVREAEDGSRALQAVRWAASVGEPYDVAILDLDMPGMNGVQLAREIKSNPDIRDVRLILLTSLGRSREIEEARRSGVEAYLTKPVRQSELRERLAALTGAPQATVERRGEPSGVHRPVAGWSGSVPSDTGILVVEDNPVNRRVAALTLEKLGYRVELATDGVEALEAFSRSRYAAILMDVQMPNMGGHEATAEIRRREGDGARRTPIIAMTANAMHDDRQKALDSGMDDHVSKPVKPEDLSTVLEHWVEKE